MSPFPAAELRSQFPALNQGSFIFFDNAAGAQIPQIVLDAINRHLVECNVQRGGRYGKSRDVDTTIARARESVATFVNAWSANEIAFGMNATSFIRTISLAIGQSLGERNEIVITDMDHEANVATWLALEREGAKFRWWQVREDGNLHSEDLQRLLSNRTRLVACTVASNALGSLVDVSEVARMAHAAGAEVFLDCVHYGPHGPIDVRQFGCDYLVCSGYKIFAPHMGFLWGRLEALRALPTFREDFIPDEPPFKVEAGTFVYENVAGMNAVVEYMETLGQRLANGSGPGSRRSRLVRAMEAIREYETGLSVELLKALGEAGADVYGVSDPAKVRERVPTVCFNLKGVQPAVVTERMAESGIGIRDGHMYSPRLMKKLGLTVEEGAVRVSLVHYNTVEEIRWFGKALAEMRRG